MEWAETMARKAVSHMEDSKYKEWKLNEAYQYYLDAEKMKEEVVPYDTEVMWVGKDHTMPYPYRVVGLFPRGRKWKVLLRGMSGTEEKATIDVFQHIYKEEK